jgi:hypothetical protein
MSSSRASEMFPMVEPPIMVWVDGSSTLGCCDKSWLLMVLARVEGSFSFVTRQSRRDTRWSLDQEPATQVIARKREQHKAGLKLVERFPELVHHASRGPGYSWSTVKPLPQKPGKGPSPPTAQERLKTNPEVKLLAGVPKKPLSGIVIVEMIPFPHRLPLFKHRPFTQ